MNPASIAINQSPFNRRVAKVSGLLRVNCGRIDPLCGPYSLFSASVLAATLEGERGLGLQRAASKAMS